MFTFSLGSGGTPTSLDPDEERKPPPAPTVVYWPQNDVHLEHDEAWASRSPDLFAEFARLVKPSDVRLSHIQALNIAVENDVPLDDFVPANPSGPDYLPPAEWTRNLDPNARRSSVSPAVQNHHERHFLLSNGTKAPDIEVFTKYARELACSTDDGLRAIGHRKLPKGHATPHLNHYREFWQKLELVSQYWETAHDDYYELDSANTSADGSPAASSKGPLRRMSLFMTDKHSHGSSKKTQDGRRYKGFRKSTGAKMPEQYRIDMVRTFIRNIIMSFHCNTTVSKGVPKLEITKLQIPVTQNSIAYRVPEDKAAIKRGILEGPVIGVQCRGDTSFAREDNLAVLDVARELAGILLLAEERAREGKPQRIPGEGKWYTTKPRWGGGPGGEFGEAEGNTDGHPFTVIKVSQGPGHLPKKMTEEEIWKELKPGRGLWEHRMSYLAVGKDRSVPQDSVFMISSIFHHISILRLDVDPLYIDFLISGIPRDKPSGSGPDRPWDRPKVFRTKWYDMLDANDRVECYRGLWGVMAYLMRSGLATGRPASQRQNSEVGSLFSLRKKHMDGGAELSHQRSQSVAF